MKMYLISEIFKSQVFMFIIQLLEADPADNHQLRGGIMVSTSAAVTWCPSTELCLPLDVSPVEKNSRVGPPGTLHPRRCHVQVLLQSYGVNDPPCRQDPDSFQAASPKCDQSAPAGVPSVRIRYVGLQLVLVARRMECVYGRHANKRRRRVA